MKRSTAALPRMPAVKAHLRALPYREVGAALDTGRGLHSLSDGETGAAVSRPGRWAYSGGPWRDLGRNRRWMRVCGAYRGERMKAGHEHRVPLSSAALAVLQEARALDDGSGLVFPSPVRRGRQMSNMTLTKVLRDTGLGQARHGSRFPQQLSRLVRRHRQGKGSGRGGARAYGGWCGGRVLPVRSVRASAPVDGRLGGLPYG